VYVSPESVRMHRYIRVANDVAADIQLYGRFGPKIRDVAVCQGTENLNYNYLLFIAFVVPGF